MVDVGVVSEATVSTARQTAKRLGAPYLLLEGRLAQSAEQIRQLGGLIASPHTERLAALAEQALAFAQREAAARSHPVSVYLARGRDGLETGRRDSIHTEVAELLGARNAGDALAGGGLAQVSIEQIILWQPDWIFTQEADFTVQVARNPLWKNVNAVREDRIGLLPRLPYGWIDGPPGINRLPGLYALAAILSGQPPARYREQILPLLEALYHHRPDPRNNACSGWPKRQCPPAGYRQFRSREARGSPAACQTRRNCTFRQFFAAKMRRQSVSAIDNFPAKRHNAASFQPILFRKEI